MRHHLLLEKIALRVRDDDVMWLCKRILKSGGKCGLPQGSVIGPLWANLYLNDVDKMLEKAQEMTKWCGRKVVSYTRYADDIVIQVSNHPGSIHWAAKVERRLRQELEKLDLKVNEEKTKLVDFSRAETFDFLGYRFRWAPSRKNPKKMTVLKTPQQEKRIKFLRNLKAVLRRHLHVPVQKVIRWFVNPRVRGWVNYFRWGNASRELWIVQWQVELQIRRFATRQRNKNRGGRCWTTWTHQEIYGQWKLHSNYRVKPWWQGSRRNCAP